MALIRNARGQTLLASHRVAPEQFGDHDDLRVLGGFDCSAGLAARGGQLVKGKLHGVAGEGRIDLEDAAHKRLRL